MQATESLLRAYEGQLPGLPYSETLLFAMATSALSYILHKSESDRKDDKDLVLRMLRTLVGKEEFQVDCSHIPERQERKSFLRAVISMLEPNEGICCHQNSSCFVYVLKVIKGDNFCKYGNLYHPWKWNCHWPLGPENSIFINLIF